MAITVQKLRRVELWDTWAAAGGHRLAVVRDVVACTLVANIENTDRLTLSVPLSSDAAAYAILGAIIRIDESDVVFDEWKITDGPTDDDGTQLRTVAASTLAATDIADCDLVRRIDSDGAAVMDFESVGLSAFQHVTQWVLPALVRGGLAWVTPGVTTPAKALDLTFEWDTPLAVLQRIAAAAEMELDIRRQGAGYVIDIIPQVGSTAPVADLRVDKNLRSGLSSGRSSTEQASRVFPRGATEDEGHATMSRAAWLITAIAGLVVTLADPAGGAGPIEFDGQLAGANGTTQAYLRKPDTTLTAVTASSALNQTVTLASVTGLSVGNTVQFRADVTGGDLSWLDSPPDRAVNGLKIGIVDGADVPSTNNIVQNSAMRSWPGAVNAPPPGWLSEGVGTIDQQVAPPFTRVGGHSIHRVGVNDGDGIISIPLPIFPTTDNPYISGFAGVWVVSGQVRVELVFTTPTSFVTEPQLPSVASSSVIGQWDDLGLTGIDAHADAATAVQLRVVQHGATPADFYVDYGQVAESPSQLPFVEGSGGTRLWQLANEHLRTNGGPLVSLTVPIADLAALDPITWGNDCKLVVGGTVRITEPRLALAVSTRLIQLERNYLVPGDTKITLSNKPDDLIGTLGERPQPSSRRGAADTGTATVEDEAISLNRFRILSELPADLTYPNGTFVYTWDRGALVSEVWAGFITFANPLPPDPWAAVLTAMGHLDDGINTLTVPKPAEGSVLYGQVEPRRSDATLAGTVKQFVVNAAPTQLPLIELDDGENGTIGTQWWSITERGLHVTLVEVQTQVGTEPVSAFGAPTRGPGAASVVRGGLLGSGQYEHDVTLDATRLSWIMPRLTLNNGQPPKTLGPFGFDRDKRPNILSVQLVGTLLTIICDSDTKSIKVSNSGGTWIYQADGVSLPNLDVSKTGTNGGAGLGTAASDTYTITAQSDPLAYVDVNTLTESRNQVIGGSTAPPATATWDSPGVSLAAPLTNGSDAATLTLKSTSSPVGWTVQVFIYIGFSSSGTPSVDHTADLTPALSSPPAASTDYTYNSGFPKSAHTAGTGLTTMKVRADLKDAGGVVQDSKTVQATWYSPV